jgi:hypothetical protein
VQPPASLADLKLVELDPRLGIAVLRGAGGEHFSLKAGDTGPGAIYKVTRLFADRIEIEVPVARSAPSRYWLWKSAAGDKSARLVPLSRDPPPEAPATMTVVVPMDMPAR